jgi:two-component system nitrate/nitrite response regulator NarL
LLAAHPSWEVCGEGADGVDAVHKVQELKPDIVVMDLSMPVMNGLRATQEITRLTPRIPIVMFSMYLSPHLTDSAQAVGARGVVSKSEPQQIVLAVETLLAGNTFFPKRNTGTSDAETIAPGA